MLEAQDFVHFQWLVQSRAPELDLIKVFFVKLLGDFVGVVGHARVGQEEVVNLIRFARGRLRIESARGIVVPGWLTAFA